MRVLTLLGALAVFCGDVIAAAAAEKIETFRSLVRTDTWWESWPGADGKAELLR